MAKSTRAGGASHTEAELNDPVLQRRPVRVRRPQMGKVDKETYSADEQEEVAESVGNNSPRSTDPQVKNDEQESPSPRPRARTTGNRSRAPERETDSTARSTAGSGRNSGSKPSSDDDDLFDDI